MMAKIIEVLIYVTGSLAIVAALLYLSLELAGKILKFTGNWIMFLEAMRIIRDKKIEAQKNG
jgi:energy-converting hydrogenase Eha subunit C